MDYRALARQIALEEGIDPDLFERLVKQESGFNPSALSPKGAIGLTQLMPGTAADLGVDPRDPVQNLRGGARYLKQQSQRFGSVPLALAAYNAGPRAVEKAKGVPNFPETKNYINRIIGSGVDVRMAATGELPPKMAVPGDPMTGMAGPARGPDLDARTLDVLKTFLGEEKDRKPKLWEDPLFQMGLGILATPTGTGSPMMGIARGMQTGMAAAQAAQQAAQENSLTSLGKKLFAIDLAQRQVGISGLTPAQQVQAVSETKQYLSPDGKTVRTVYEVKTPDGRLEVRDAFTHQPADEVSGWPRVSPSADPLGGSKESAGQKTGQAKIEAELRAYDNALSLAEELETMAFGGKDSASGGAFRNTPGGALGLPRLATGLGNIYRAVAQPEGDTEAQRYEEKRQATAAIFARMFGEKGAMSNQDIMRALFNLPEADFFPDSTPKAKEKFEDLKATIRAQRERAAQDLKATPPVTTQALPKRPSSTATSPVNKPLEEMTLEELERHYKWLEDQEKALGAGGM